jgi:hypothetical protein
VILELHSWPAPSQAFALVANLRLKLRYTWHASIYVVNYLTNNVYDGLLWSINGNEMYVQCFESPNVVINFYFAKQVFGLALRLQNSQAKKKETLQC